jgi:hypothetical protein
MNERITSARLMGDSIEIIENDSTFYVDLSKYNAAINNDNDSTNELVDSLRLTNGVLELYEQGLMTGSIALDTLGDYKRSLMQNEIALNRDSIDILQDSMANYNNRITTNSTNITSNQTAITNHLSADFDTDTTNERITSARLMGDSIEIIENDSTFYVDLSKYNAAINNDNDSTNELVDSLRLTNGVLELYEQGLMTGSIALDTLGDYKRGLIQNQVTSNSFALTNHLAADFDTDTMNERITSARLMGDSIEIIENDSTFYVDLSKYNAAINNDNDSTNELVDSLRLTNGVLELYEQGLMTGSIALDTLGNYQRSLIQNSIALNRDSIDILQDSVINYNTRIGNNASAITNHLSADLDTDSLNERINSAKLVGTDLVIVENDSTFTIDLSTFSNALNNDNDATNELIDSLAINNDFLEIYENGLLSKSISLDTIGNAERAIIQGQVTANATAIGNETTARTTADGNLSTRITNDSTSLRTIAGNLAVRIANDSSLTVQNRDSINSVVSNLSDTAAVLRGLIPSASTDDQTLSISVGKGKITLEDGGTIVLNDSSATNELQYLSINGTNDSLLLSDGNGVRLSDITSGITDNQNLSITTDSIKIQNGQGAYIGDIRDTLGAHNTRINTNLNSIKTNATAIGNETIARTTSDGNLAARIANDSSLTVQNRDSINSVVSNLSDTAAVLRGLIPAASTDDQALSISTGKGKITLEDGGTVVLNDSSATNELQYLSINGTNDSLLLSDGNGVRLSDITSGITDNQNLSITTDSIKIQNGQGAYIGDIRDTLGAHNSRINTNLNSIKTNATAIGNETIARTTSDGNLSTRIINDSTSLRTIAGNLAARIANDSSLTVQNRDSINSVVSNLSDTAAVLRGLIPASSTDDQTLSISAGKGKISLEDGGTIVLNDSSATNELQNLSINGANDSLLLSKGIGIRLSDIPSGDSLWNHRATENIKLFGNYLSNDGDNEGILINNTGQVGIGTNANSSYALNVEGETRFHLPGDGDRILIDAIDNGGITIKKGAQNWSAELFLMGASYQSALELKTVGGELKFYSPGLTGPDTSFIQTSGALLFKNNGIQSLIATKEGKIGIGNSLTPDSLLTVNGGIMANSIRLTEGAGTNKVLTSFDATGAAKWEDISNLIAADTSNIISDTDGDTKIDVEASTDEDIIHFYQKGTEFIRMDSGRIEMLNRNNLVAIGENAGKNYTGTGDGSTFIGAFSGESNINGESNTGLGANTLKLTTSSYNTAVGFNVLSRNTTGADNVGMGDYSLEYATTADGNSAFGSAALENTTTGSNNTAMGRYALRDNTTGTRNVGLGAYALVTNKTGSDNVAIGEQAMQNHESGDANTAIGGQSLYQNNGGNNNIAIGWGAGYINSTGNNNTIIGYEGLYLNSTGSANTAIGYQAGYNNTTDTGNVFLGYKAGWNATSSNKLYIENTPSSTPLIYGDFEKDSVVINSKLNVGGNYTFPTSSGTANQILKYNAAGNGLEWGTISGADNLGNHTATQNIKLDGKYLSGDGDNEGIHVAPNGNVTIGGNTGYTQFSVRNSTGDNEVSLWSGVGKSELGFYSYGSGSNSGSILSFFKARGSSASSTAVASGDNIATFESTLKYDASNAIVRPFLKLDIDGTVSTGGIVPTRLSFYTGDNSGGNNLAMIIKSSGNVGIGTTFPDSTLTVDGGIMANSLRLSNGAGLGKVLTSSSNGSASWSDVSSLFSQDTLSLIRSSDSSTYVSATIPGEVNIAVNDTVFFEFDKRRLEFLNTFSIIIGNDAAINANKNTEVTAIGQGALRNNTTGGGNLAIGTGGILGNNAIGAENTAVGHITMRQNISGNRNSAFGAGAMDFYFNGDENTALGQRALENGNDGDFNTAVGGRALNINAGGDNNVAIGFESGAGSNGGSNNVFIGFQSGYNETGNNKLYLANDSTRTPLIFGDFAADSLAINGLLTLDSAKDGTGYTFPGTQGANGQVLTSDGSGGVTWKAPTVAAETCPSGTVAAGPKMCIETAERGATTWFTAALTCTGLGRKLPTWAEWYAGVSLGTGLANTTDDWEWVDGGTSNTVRKVGNGGIQNTANDTPTNSVDVTFRCVYYR